MDFLQANWGWILAIGTPMASFIALQYRMFYTLVAHANALEALVPKVEKMDDTISTHGERISKLEGGLVRV